MTVTPPTTVLELLVAARELIGVRERWCFGAMARTKRGYPVSPRAPSAVSWCAMGALERCASKRSDAQKLQALDLLIDAAQYLCSGSIVYLNDLGKYPAVLLAYERAIAQAHVIEAQS